MAVTIKEIAEKANVSSATVSMVLNNKKGISSATRENVLKIVKDLGYSFSSNKKNSTSNRGNLQLTIFKKHSKVVSDTPFFQALTEGIESEARHNSYKLNITYMSRSANINDIKKDLKKNSIDGMLLLGTEMDEQDFIEFLDIDIPILFLDSNFININANYVVIDNISGAYKGTKHLLDNGHRNIGYLKSSISIQNFEERYEGYKKALDEAQITNSSNYIVSLMPTMNEAYKDMKKYLSGNPYLPTAYIADNDIIAMGAIKALKENSYKIPEDISIVGFDDMPFCTMIEPTLTTINVNKKIFGHLAIDNLIDIIERKKNYKLKTVLSVTLILRNSVMPIK